MWSLWTKATRYSKLPSEIFGEEDALAAWMLDNAVTWFGITIENALAERVKVQTGKDNYRYDPKYTLARLLNPSFKLPRPPVEQTSSNPFAALLPYAGKKNSGIKRYKYVAPEEKKED